MPPKMTLYQCPFYRSFRCMWLIYELGAEDDFQFKRLDSLKKDTAEFKEFQKKVHPHGTIPALEIEGEAPVLESGAICLYLADLYGKLVPPPAQRKEYYDWSIYGCCTLDEIADFLYYQWVLTPEKPDPEGVKKLCDKFAIAMERLTKTLEDRQWICGDEFTAADCILGYPLWNAGEDVFNKGVLLKDFPKAREYLERLKSRPAFQRAIKAQNQ